MSEEKTVFETPRPEDVLPTLEGRTRYNESMDLAEAAHLVLSMRQRAKKPDGKRGITQAELAERIGVTQSRVSQIESGEGRDGPSFTLLKRIARACGVPWPAELPATDLAPRVRAEPSSELRALAASINALVARSLGQDPRPGGQESRARPSGLQARIESLRARHRSLEEVIDAEISPAASGAVLLAGDVSYAHKRWKLVIEDVAPTRIVAGRNIEQPGSFKPSNEK